VQHIAAAIFSLPCQTQSLKNKKNWKQFIPYSVQARLRHFGPGFGNVIYGMFDVQGFPKFVQSGFVFAINCLNKFSKHLTEVISPNVTIISWSIDCRSGIMLGGKKMTFFFFCVLIMSQLQEDVQEHYPTQEKALNPYSRPCSMLLVQLIIKPCSEYWA
jgi:hypothetical protein